MYDRFSRITAHTSSADWQTWSGNVVKRVAKRKERKHPHPRMHQPHGTADSKISQSKSQSEADERRARHREEGVLSRIEDITYKVLRQHEPKKP
jgi:hypothetical protein